MAQSTLGQKPRVPQPQAFLHPANTSVRLNLFDWDAETCPVSYFVVEYRPRASPRWTLVSNNLQVRTH